MNDPISWDPSLVKKFSSSNHYKLLNQLKNEVKKYPLNNKNKSISIQRQDTKQDTKSKSYISNSKNISLSNSSYKNDESNGNKSSVSFNNAKNFSIYNNNNNNRKNENLMTENSNIKEENSSQTFKDRLNQIDMK